MELDLALDPDDAARLSRLALLAPLRRGRTRHRQVHIVWHDSPDRALAGQGLALAEQRPYWRLERLDGAQPRVVATERHRAALGHLIPDALIPLAAFEGRSHGVALEGEHGPIAMTALNGVVRTVARQHRLSRIRFEGTLPGVRSLANAMAGDLRLTAALDSLPAEALSAAAGKPISTHEGAAELPAGLSVADAFAHVVAHLAGVILHFAPIAAAGTDGPEPVHQMRVAVRRLRSAIKVFRRALRCAAVDEADHGLKALAGKLGPTRDWDVFVTETVVGVSGAFPREKRLERLLASAQRRRRACHDELRTFLGSSEFRRLGIALACLSGTQDWHAELTDVERAEMAIPIEEFAARELQRRLKRLVQADGDIAELDPGALHAIRLRAKRLRYAAEIFSLLYSAKTTSRYIRRLSKLQDRLGSLNDGSVASGLLAELSGGGGHSFATGLVLGFVGANSMRARQRIERAWDRFHRIAAFWD